MAICVCVLGGEGRWKAPYFLPDSFAPHGNENILGGVSTLDCHLNLRKFKSGFDIEVRLLESVTSRSTVSNFLERTNL